MELKKAVPRPGELAERMYGMANAQGGLIIIGVEDSSLAVVGVPDAIPDLSALAGRKVIAVDADSARLHDFAKAATEAAAEGLNLQFCRVVINYDLPWSPQKIEQRIGRVHRIGQTQEVFVFNFCQAGSIEEQLLRDYVLHGGLIVGNADCGMKAFSQSFTALGTRLFPAYVFRPLPPDHPPWFHGPTTR